MSGMHVGLQVYGQAKAVENLKIQNLSPEAYLGFEDQFFRELNIQRAGVEGKASAGAVDGGVGAAQLGGLSSPATVAALQRMTQEIASNSRG